MVPAMTGGLHVEDIVMGYGPSTVIDGITVHADADEFVAVTGANGSGKSTLLRGLAGLQPMGFGTYRIDGVDCLPESRQHRQWTHSITDNWMWLRGLTLRDHLRMFAASSDGVDGVDAALAQFGLEDLADRLPVSLSSGQLQRAALSSIMVRPWRVLFLDEPEQRLDGQYLQVLAEALHPLLPGRVIVAATHAPELFEDYTTQTVHLGGE